MHVRLLVFLATAFLFCSCVDKKNKANEYAQVDSLNALSYDMRYKDLKKSGRLAVEAYNLSKEQTAPRAEALNNIAFCAFMQMDFERSLSLYESSLKEGGNEINHLISDIGLMKIYQRTSQNKLFYDCRNRAQKRMQRIREDEALITNAREKRLFYYAVSEFYIVSGIYFYYLQQHEESIASIDAIHEESLKADTAQWLYYEYMRGSGGMYRANSYEEILEGELGYLADCLAQSREKGYIYFEANALQGIAELLNSPKNRSILKNDRRGLLRLINDKSLPMDSLPLYCAKKALYLFKLYGDWYQSSGAYRTIATFYNYSGQPQKALANLRNGLQYVNKHHEKYYHCPDTTDRLFTYVPQSGFSRELRWVSDEGIKTVPEWILRLREQLSRTYAAMGRKQESDYNRNIYLDLLDYTRQDKSVESRFSQLAKESKQLNLLLWLVMGSFFLLTFLFVILSKYWRKKNQCYVDKVKQAFVLCQKIIDSIPPKVTDANKLAADILASTNAEFKQLFGAEEIHISLQGDDETEGDNVWEGEKMELLFPGTNEVVGYLFLALKRPLSKREKFLLQMVIPYFAWALGKGLNWVSLEDEKVRLEKERYVYMRRLQENKRQNIAKKACVSVVTDTLPYIDRIIHEVSKLKSTSKNLDFDQISRRIGYVNELIARINEYNEILSIWIRMRKGELKLNIETFSLKELFEIVAKRKQAFEMKRISFKVCQTECMAKADKALTLFMINTLVENARKYTQEGGHVSLSAEESENYIEISVSDDGPGLSASDVKCILNEKVYDSDKIGIDTATDMSKLKEKKGFGFGLMNCKGIIDKYRKTNNLFSVCKFDIQSTPGQGSRFFFRLPKGFARTFMSLCIGICMAVGVVGCTADRPHGRVGESTSSESVASYDSLLAIANNYANRVYECNVQANYLQALSLADSVLYYMNAHYLCYSGKSAPLLNMCDENSETAEQQWLANGFDTDYYILLDVRNEIAVAALAIKKFQLYYYNNAAYAALYKQISKDRSLEAYCEQMQQASNNKIIVLVLFLVLVMAALIAYYVLYVRRSQHYEYGMEQVFAINQTMFQATSQLTDLDDESKDESSLLNAIFPEMNELVPITDMALGIYNEDSQSLKYSFYAEGKGDDDLCALMRHCLDEKKNMWQPGDNWNCFFLSVRVEEDMHPVGVLAMKIEKWQNREEDKIFVEWVVGYLSAVLYNAIIRTHRQYVDIEFAQDETRRILSEENALHVQNMVLDNCLSAIKHETIYYPSRIKKIMDTIQFQGEDSIGKEQGKINDISELVEYYRDIFAILASCALHQLDGKTFRREEISAKKIIENAASYFNKKTRECPVCTLTTEIGDDDATFIGDETLLAFLFENLINEAIRCRQAGELVMSYKIIDGFIRFNFTDRRRNYTQEELNELFYPSLKWMCPDKDADFIGTEYLLCKQIIREHDENLGHRGCRINASVCAEGGFCVWFTIPQSGRGVLG